VELYLKPLPFQLCERNPGYTYGTTYTIDLESEKSLGEKIFGGTTLCIAMRKIPVSQIMVKRFFCEFHSRSHLAGYELRAEVDLPLTAGGPVCGHPAAWPPGLVPTGQPYLTQLADTFMIMWVG
jgi:hypothetical protein